VTTTGVQANPPTTTPPNIDPTQNPNIIGMNALLPRVAPLFGYSFFAEARAAVDARRRKNGGSEVINALATPISPDMANNGITLPTPQRYTLGAGDEIIVRYSSPTRDATESKLRIDSRGYIDVPESSERIIARGQTLAQFEKQMQVAMKDVLRGVTVSVTMGELRSIPIVILGEAYAPGTYMMPSVVTLFNALYISGGPGDFGSFRKIRLKRPNGISKTIDLYELFMKGNGALDIPLDAGDVIMVMPRDKVVYVNGEVRRPASYELLPTDKLKDVLRLAGGLKPSGISQRILVESVRPGIDRRLIDVNLLQTGKAGNPELQDNDVVEVYSIRPIISNQVSIIGPVDQPRNYAYRKGMKVSDLVVLSRGLLPGAALERADLFRLNADGSTRLIKVQLRQALVKGSKVNPLLMPNDRLVIYRTEDLQFLGNRRLSIQGSVRAPGIYIRSDNMTLRDLLIQAKGLTPDAYPDLAFVQRINQNGNPADFLRVNLRKVLAGDEKENILLRDDDRITVNSIRDVNFIPDQTVAIVGAVARPGVYVKGTNMRLRDLVQTAGYLLPNAYPEKALLQRFKLDGSADVLLTVDLRKLLAGDATSNVLLQARDRLTVYTEDDVMFKPEQQVTVVGAVQRPGSFVRAEGMTVRDLLLLAGNLLPTTYPDKALLQRFKLDGTADVLLTINLRKVFEGDVKNNVELRPRDRLTVFTEAEVMFKPEQQVAILGAVQRPGTFVRSEGMTIRDLLLLAGNVLPTAYPDKAFLQRTRIDGTAEAMVPINLVKALNGDPSDNLVLQPRDRLTVFTVNDSMFLPEQQVEIIGPVQRPGSYVRSDGMTIRDLINYTGNLLPTAFLERAFLQRFKIDGTPEVLLTLDLRKVLVGDPEQNLVLQPRDRLTIYTQTQAIFTPTQGVEIVGAVQNPSKYVRSDGMTVLDLINLAGGPLPSTYRDKLYLQRLNPNGTQGPLVILNLDKVLANDPSNNLVLLNNDRLSVFDQREVKFRIPETVKIAGAVQRPGEFIRANNMRLRDLIELSGGVIPTASETFEIGKVFQPLGTPPRRIRVADVVSGNEAANVALEPGDLVTLPNRSDIRSAPRFVVLGGAVRFPGPYQLMGENDRLSSVIQRAGGLMPTAYPPATEFVRDPRFLSTNTQVFAQPDVLEQIQKVQTDEYKRASAQADLDRLRIVFGSGASVSSTGSILGGGGVPTGSSVMPGQSLDQALAKALGAEAVTRARPLTEKDLSPSGNLAVDLAGALRRPGSARDVILREGDVITVPETPTTVVVTGAVLRPSAVTFAAGKSILYYINFAGGLAGDASVDQIIIVRANGQLIRYRPGVKVELGDNIIVPTKVVAARLQLKKDVLEQATSTITSAAVTIGLIRALSK
jgi:protein involved in polysaccharide export with SLBB domain